MRRVLLALMGAAERAWREAGGPRNRDNPADPYMTVLGYFNSLRELGGARRILEEEVQNTLKRYGDRRRLGEAQGLFRDRSSFSDVVELTSRVGTDKVAEARTRLGCTFHDRRQRVDCAIASNMISVGLDIQRLGLMLVYGQPKTHSEYIQATSRVGRDDRRPGLVVALYNVHKPRDRSHYERFRHYHETFYRSVDVSSVTPFAARALDRGFAGALVALARHALPTMTPPDGVEGIETERAALVPSSTRSWMPCWRSRKATATTLPSIRTFTLAGCRNRYGATRHDSSIEAIIQVHRLREVLALAGFTRLEPVMPNVDGEYDGEVERAVIALEPAWFPAVENRGEGILVQLRADVVMAWLGREPVKQRLNELIAGHNAWAGQRKSELPFPGGPYVLLHTLAHLLLQSLSMRCGYPAASIRERIFVDQASSRSERNPHGKRYAVLLYTTSPDAEGTLGGLVQEARRIEDHLRHALRTAALCSNDPVCAEHVPGHSMEERWLHGAACHGCTLIAETSCEMRNEYLDRALAVPTLYAAGAAFFGTP